MADGEIKYQRIADRRMAFVDFGRRKFIRRGRTFVYPREIYLSDTNAYSNVYFANFIHFIGEAREAWLQWLLGDNATAFFQSGIGMVTVDTDIKYKDSLYCFDKIEVKVTVTKLSRTKLVFHFDIVNQKTKKLSAAANMTVGAVFNGKIVIIPSILSDQIKKKGLL